ncbi:uncharacterized protein LOC116413267 [Galleria mellonella]|uniref:Uncharacterized protein LOC116413267 n=1 Tax=Galleria mellonella TaxID=7137 RepID=A0A6J3C5V8_GALME|nr:uncharacterized protein LOC116413267 [Galleria mellonella]
MILLKMLITFIFINLSKCTIQGINYMDPLNIRSTQDTWHRGKDPCNTLYWYPKQIPNYCYITTPKPEIGAPRVPIPLPIPVPLPLAPMFPAPPALPLPYGIPVAPSNPMLPIAGVPYSAPIVPFQYQPYYRRNQLGMVPGLPGLVTRDRGINIMPFSDVYSDLMEKQKKKMLTEKLWQIFKAYDDYPWHRRIRSKKYRKRL